MTEVLTDKAVADTVQGFRAEADRGLQPAKLNAVAHQIEQIWDAIKRGDQPKVDELGLALMLNRVSLPTPESSIVWNAMEVIDRLLSQVRLH